MKAFEHGATYWLLAGDGSKLQVTAVEAGDGEIDLLNDQFSFSIWAGGNNLDEFELQRIDKEEHFGLPGDRGVGDNK